MKVVEFYCQATKKFGGLIDHYYVVDGENEIHPRGFKPGEILPKGSTKGAHLVSVNTICDKCYNELMAIFKLKEDVRLFNSFFPFLNCETLCKGFSIQSLAFIAIPFVIVLIIKGLFLWALVLFLATLIALLIYSKYVFSRTIKTKCKHLILNESSNDVHKAKHF